MRRATPRESRAAPFSPSRSSPTRLAGRVARTTVYLFRYFYVCCCVFVPRPPRYGAATRRCAPPPLLPPSSRHSKLGPLGHEQHGQRSLPARPASAVGSVAGPVRGRCQSLSRCARQRVSEAAMFAEGPVGPAPSRGPSAAVASGRGPGGHHWAPCSGGGWATASCRDDGQGMQCTQ